MVNKKSLLVTSTVLISALFFLIKSKNDADENLKDFVVEEKIQSSTVNVSTIVNKSVSSNLNNKQPITDEKKKELIAAIENAKKWFREKGFYDGKDLQEYQGYDDDTLSIIAKSGDVKAITILANRLHGRGKLEYAMLLYTDGAIRGSVYSLQHLSQISHHFYSRHLKDGNLEAANKFAIDIVAWDRLAKKRGYSAVIEYMGVSDTDPSFSYLKTPDGIRDVENAVDMHYKIIEDERIRIGLGAFDNNISDAWAKIKAIDENYYDPSIKNDSRRLSEVYAEEN
jgi:hypothetical protein